MALSNCVFTQHSFIPGKILCSRLGVGARSTFTARDFRFRNISAITVSKVISLEVLFRKNETFRGWNMSTTVRRSASAGPGGEGLNAVDSSKKGLESTTSSEKPKQDPQPESQAPISRKEKLKKAIKDYGGTVIVFHVAISLLSLGFCYLLVSSGLDLAYMLKQIGVGESILQNRITQGASNFVVAYAVHKVFAPLRITITLTATPLIVRRLRTMGFLKKPIS